MRFLTILLLLSTQCFAIETDKAAHIGTSYAIQTASYGLAKKAFKMDQTNAIIFSAFTTFMVGFTKEMMDAGKTRRLDMGDLGANVAGQALSIGTVLMFDF